MWEMESLDVHRVVDAYVPPPDVGRVRVWYDACPCSVEACNDIEDEIILSAQPDDEGDTDDGVADRGDAASDDDNGTRAGDELDVVQGHDAPGDADTDMSERGSANNYGFETCSIASVPSIDTRSSTSLLDPNIDPSTCDQHITLAGRSSDMTATIGGTGTRLKRENGESVDRVVQWEFVDTWRTATILQSLEENAKGGEGEISETGVAQCGHGASGGQGAVSDKGRGKDGQDAVERIAQWAEESMRGVKQDVEKGVLARDVLDKVSIVPRDQVESCCVCGGQ